MAAELADTTEHRGRQRRQIGLALADGLGPPRARTVVELRGQRRRVGDGARGECGERFGRGPIPRPRRPRRRRASPCRRRWRATRSGVRRRAMLTTLEGEGTKSTVIASARPGSDSVAVSPVSATRRASSGRASARTWSPASTRSDRVTSFKPSRKGPPSVRITRPASCKGGQQPRGRRGVDPDPPRQLVDAERGVSEAASTSSDWRRARAEPTAPRRVWGTRQAGSGRHSQKPGRRGRAGPRPLDPLRAPADLPRHPSRARGVQRAHHHHLDAPRGRTGRASTPPGRRARRR